MSCAPIARPGAENDTEPSASSAAVPSTVEPSLKVTEPAGVPMPGVFAATCTVRVTGWPAGTVVAGEVRVMVEPARTTVWVSTDELPVLKPLSPG